MAVKALHLLAAAAALPLACAQQQQVFDTGAFLTTPATFPSPTTNGTGGWDAALVKANDFLNQLNMTEKITLVTGTVFTGCVGGIAAIPRLNFSGLCLQDGPAGIRTADLASSFSGGVNAAASWDRNLMYERGSDMAAEFRAKGAHVALGPVAGPLGRKALGGRNWEGFSPDPYLTGVAMDTTIRGIQSQGVQACAKHLMGNEQETNRAGFTSANGTSVEAYSANIDDRTVHEVYLWPFADAVKAGVASVMCSYNRLNQTYACENSKLLNGYLKDELAFQGYVMSDWYATHSGAVAIKAGLDMNMPGPLNPAAGAAAYTNPGVVPSYFGQNISIAIQNSSLTVARLDDMVRRIMTPYFFLGQDSGFPTVDPTSLTVLAAANNYRLSASLGYPTVARDVRDDHAAGIRRLGAASTVLLKNVNSTLPLKKPMNIGVFGNDAPDVTAGLQASTVEIGTLAIGGGSGTNRPTYIISPLRAIMDRAASYGARVQYVTDNSRISAADFSTIFPVPDVCLVFVHTYAAENEDRTNLEADYNSTLVVNQVASLCPNTIVVTHSGGINTMPWASNPNVNAILAAHYPGQETGHSIVDVLFGDTNPSARLPYTIARNASDYNTPLLNLTGANASNSAAWQDNYSEGLMIDYRHFDAAGIEPLYPFGFGLSYSNFSIVNSSLSLQAVQPVPVSVRPNAYAKVAPGGNPDLYTVLVSLSTRIANTSPVPGDAVVQLYVSPDQANVPTGTPIRVLRGFEKVHVTAERNVKVEFELTRRDLSYWDTEAQDWMLACGDITVSVGFSSRDLPATGTVRLC